MIFPLRFGLEKVGLPLIATYGKLGGLCFVIDTGSEANCIFDFVYEHFKDEFKVLEGQKHFGMGIDGFCQEISTIIEATFNFEGTDYTSTFDVIGSAAAFKTQADTGIQIHGILSADFLNKAHWIIDFNKNWITDEKWR